MAFLPYTGNAYLDYPEVQAWCAQAAEAYPNLLTVSTVGTSRHGRPLLLLTLGDQSGDVMGRPALWIDGGTHASEWTGVMACLFAVSRWLEQVEAGDEDLRAWLQEHTIYVLPCVSPDGFQYTLEGKPVVRSSLRPPRDGRPRVGLEPCDITGNGVVSLMRWRHAAGPWVFDDPAGVRMRHRRLDDDPEDCWMVTQEGRLIGWDGVRWVSAPLEHGVDLNRNFPVRWQPFSMFGQDSGAYPLSEPESRAVVEAFTERPTISAVLSNHTYTGALLCQPYREPSPLPASDLKLMKGLADDAVRGTTYRVYKVHPEFVYDPSQPIIGVWADAATTTFGVPAYTLELWDPYGAAGETVENPARLFAEPDVELVGRMVEALGAEEGASLPWTEVDHPELGPVEVGGLRYLTTVRNPPLRLLPAECAQGFTVADRLRRALPRLRVDVEVERLDDHTHRVRLVVENVGFLPSSALLHGEVGGTAPPIVATLTEKGCELIEGDRVRNLGWLDGWGSLQYGSAAHPVYPSLPAERGVRTGASWLVRGSGSLVVRWDGGRAGRGDVAVVL